MRMDEALQDGLQALREYLDFLDTRRRELEEQLARARRETAAPPGQEEQAGQQEQDAPSQVSRAEGEADGWL